MYRELADRTIEIHIGDSPGALILAHQIIESRRLAVRFGDLSLHHDIRAAGVACGLKPSGGPDLALLVCDRDDAVSATRFSRSGVLAAPVLLTQERCRLEALRAVVVNAGNANAATGRRGLDDAAKVQGAAAAAAAVGPDRVAVCSTPGSFAQAARHLAAKHRIPRPWTDDAPPAERDRG